jgi:glycosyltransferase involved in cell wall biosynthesis
LVKYVNDNNLYQTVKFWGYQKNPYKFLSKSDFYVCPSYKEGFSVAATEAVLLGKPVVTTDVFGMKELLGENEYGIISANDTESLYGSVLKMLSDDCLKHYTQQAKIRSKEFCQINRINKIEELFE